jgi:hypothetical protein
MGLVDQEIITDPPFGVTLVNGYTYKTLNLTVYLFWNMMTE